MSTESHIAVPIDVRACSCFKKWEPSERRVTGNFLSIFSNISCGYVVNNMSTFSQRIYTIWKNDPWRLPKPEFRHKPEHFHPCNSDDNKDHNSYNVDDDFGDWDNYVVYIFLLPKIHILMI